MNRAEDARWVSTVAQNVYSTSAEFVEKLVREQRHIYTEEDRKYHKVPARPRKEYEPGTTTMASFAI